MFRNSEDDYSAAQKVVLFHLFYHCQLMYDYLTETGRKVPEEIGNELAEINIKTHTLSHSYNQKVYEEMKNEQRKKERRKIRRAFYKDLEFDYHTKIACALVNDKNKLTKMFNILSKLSKPASPCTLENTIPKWKIFIFFGQKCDPFSCFMYWNGIIYLLGYILTGILNIIYPESNNMSNETPSFFIKLNTQALLFFSAGLGGSLYALITSRKYLLKRTFDNKYIPHYVNRILVGIMTGFILSNLILPSSLKNMDGIIAQLTPSMIALLGGFSADVVIQILNRIVIMLKAMVEGDVKQIVDNNEQMIKTKMEAERIKRNLNYVVELRSKLDSSGLHKDTPAFQKIDEVINKMIEDEEVKIEEEVLT